LASARREEAGMPKPNVLVLDNDKSVRHAIANALLGIATLCEVDSIGGARRMTERVPWSAIVVGTTLPDGNGLEWLAETRHAHDRRPALIVAERCDRGVINAAFALGASLLCKPLEPDLLMTFSNRLFDSSNINSVMVAIRAVGGGRELTAREIELLASAVRGVGRSEFVSERRISMNTYKTQVRSILRKTRACSLGEVRDRVLQRLHARVVTPQG
jgi:DNA-binding NarL/FixJ family response regulator